MARTQVKGQQVEDGSIEKVDLCIDKPGASVITRVLPGNGIALSSTGIDEGTGDVTINVVPNSTSTVQQYVHTQDTLSDTWVITHNLGTYPEVMLIDIDGHRTYGELHYISGLVIEVRFTTAQIGLAALTAVIGTQEGHTQTTNSDTWTIEHNLGRYPDIIIFDSSMDNIRVYGDIKYPTINSVIITFTLPMTGEAHFI